MADRSPPLAREQAAELDHYAIQHENLMLRELVTVYQQLTGLTLQDADVSTVARLLAERTGATVSVVSRGLEVIAAAAPSGESDTHAAAATAGGSADTAERVRVYLANSRMAGVLKSSAHARRSLRLPDVGDSGPVIVAPIVVGHDVPAYLLTIGGAQPADGGDVNLLVTEHAATICGVILGRDRVVATAARQVRDDLVEGLLLGSARHNGDVGQWARHLGYDESYEHRIIAVAVTISDGARPGGAVPARKARVSAAVEHFFVTHVRGAITSIRENDVVVVAPEPMHGQSAVGDLGLACVTRMRELFPDAVCTVGIGGPCREPTEIAGSYGQARRTIETILRLGRQGEVVAFEDLGILRVLLQVPDLTELRSFASEVLGALTCKDRQRGDELLATLACYFQENYSPQRTARRLFVHPNTVSYRINRIQEITGLRLDAYRDRLIAQVALEILDALGEGPHAASNRRGA